MGAGASMEDEAPPPGPPRGQQRPHSRGPVSAKSNRGSSALSRTGSGNSTWKTALKSNSLAATGLRKMRAAALGRKSACTVAIDKTGFSLQHIQICEGQVVTFEWTDQESKGFNVTQVVHDGDQYKPVIGGFNSGPVQRKGFFEQQFNIAGEYKFVSAGLRCTPLTVEVYPRKDVEAELSDDGFSPRLIRVDEGNAIRWTWSGCGVPHSVFEVKFSHKTGTVVNKDSQDRPIPTKAGSFRKQFNKPGMYYYQSEGYTSGEMFTCMVHVRERQREYRIDVLDRAFKPPIIVIEEGDRLWWEWSKKTCKKPHCIYQIEAPPLNHPSDESYKPKKNGFKWPTPTKAGLISAEFFDPGVFYYSDHNFEEAAEYIGTIIVKPKQIEHFIELNREGFTPDLLYANTGERIWWTWGSEDVDANFMINEIEKCVSPVCSRPNIENESSGEGSYIDEDLENLKVSCGLDTVQLGSIGVYHYRVSDSPTNISTVSIIVNGGPKNHTIHVTDQGFEPKVVTIHPGDRVWWVWQEGAKQHNVIQVSHQGKHIGGGFCSGAAVDCPSAFMYQFDTAGVYYYISDALAKSFGAIVVTSQPRVHEVEVTGSALNPDPLAINVNDVVAWTFRGLRQNDVQQVETAEHLLDAQFNAAVVPPRRSMNRLFTEKGVFHFTSKSFLKQGKKSHDQNGSGNLPRISSVLVDDINDSTVVRVDSKGFHPDAITILKTQSVLWTWKDGGEEAHNIIHVNNPNSEAPLSVIQGGRSFNSGRPVPQNSFLYTFDDPGHYCVASQGSPGYAGTIRVLDDEKQCATPAIIPGRSINYMNVDKFAKIELTCSTPGGKIYYTLDGTAPEPHKLTAKRVRFKHVNRHLKGYTKIYEPEKGCVLKSSGLCFVRAMAVAVGYTDSDVFTSQRLNVGNGEPEHESEPEPEPEKEDPDRWHWWNCVPTIKGVFTNPGTMEIFWDPPPDESRHLIRSYQLTLNGVSYCAQFPPVYNSVNVSGLAGGRLYEVVLETNPIDSMFLPHKSNTLNMKCVQTTSSGGPVVSLETTEKVDAMAIVWMSISTQHNPIDGYRVYLNGQMCGNQVVPEENSDRCKVVIEGCQTDFVYRIQVAAVPKGGTSPKMSNELEIQLPLITRHIKLPAKELRADDEDLYREYIEVREGDQASPTDTVHQVSHEIPTLDLTNEQVASQSRHNKSRRRRKRRKRHSERQERDTVGRSTDDRETPMSTARSSLSVIGLGSLDADTIANMLDPTQGSPDEMDEELDEEGEHYHGGGGLGSMITQDASNYNHPSANRLAPQLSIQSSINEEPYSEGYDEFEEDVFPQSHPPQPPSQQQQESHPPRPPMEPLRSRSMSGSHAGTPASLYESQTHINGHAQDYIQGRDSRPPTGNRHVPPMSPVKHPRTESLASRTSLSSKTRPVAEAHAMVRQPSAGYRRQSPPMSRPPTGHQSISAGQYAPANQSAVLSMSQMKKGGFNGDMAPKPPLPTYQDAPVGKNSLASHSSQYLAPPDHHAPAAEEAQHPQALAPKLAKGAEGGTNWAALQFAHKFKPTKVKPGQHTTTMRPPPVPKHPEELAQLGYQVNWMPEYDPTKPQWIQDEKKRAQAAAYNKDPGPVPGIEVQEDAVGFIDATKGPWKNKMKIASEGFRAARRMKKEEVIEPEDKNKTQLPEGNCEIEVEEDEEQPKPAPHLIWPAKSKKKKTAVIPVSDEAHLSIREQPPPLEGAVTPTVPVLGQSDQDDFLPAPVVTATNQGTDTVLVAWTFPRSAEPLYRLMVNVVNIIGVKFKKDVNSDISFECLHDETGNGAVAAVQHCWNVTNGDRCVIRGLTAGVAYHVYVVANYAYNQSQQPCEIQAKSKPIKYTTLGPPMAPIMKVSAADLYQVTVNWEPGEAHEDVTITGYQVYADGAPLGPPLKTTVGSTTIDSLQPGRTVKVSVVALTDHPVGNSDPSNTIKVICPARPPAPPITQQPSYKKGSVIVAWDKPPGTESVPYGEDIVFYRVFVDNTIHGEVKATSSCDRNGYQYYLSSLTAGQSYDVQVKSYCGQKKVDPTADQVFCLCESDTSNNVPSMCPAPPQSPHLRIEGMNLEGIDVTWEMPQQFGDATISGYQMLKNGKLYGSIIPPDVHSLRVKGITLGESIDLQILALTDHPVGRGELEAAREADSGIGASSAPDSNGPSEIFLGDRYAACAPGPKLRVHYSGLVQPPSKVWCEQVTGHSALIVWSKDEKPKQHYVSPESYQVTWWPGEKADKDINSQSTKEDHLLITGLRPSTLYSVVIEGRRMQKYAEVDETGGVPDDGFNNTFILTAQSEKLSVDTARPPRAPSNVGVINTTCNSVQVQWDPITDQGVEIIGIRVDAVPMNAKGKVKHVCAEVMPDTTSAILEGLQEKLEYLVTITAVTEEYFEQLPPGHELRSSKVLPKNKPPKEDPWLPSTSVMANTSGTEPPTEIKVTKTTIDSVTFTWKYPKVHGSNRLQGTVIRWAEAKFTRGQDNKKQDETEMLHHKTIAADGNEATLEGLCPGLLYKILVEAVVSVKNVLAAGDSKSVEVEAQDRRTTHVQSKPLYIRTRAPCEPPRPIITGYTTNSVQLYWEKPLLFYQIGQMEEGHPKYLKLYLEGYKILINGKPHMKLAPNAQNCTLIKCKPGKTYTIVLVAITCTEDCRREKKRRVKSLKGSTAGTEISSKSWESMLEEFENDESESAALEVTLPKLHQGYLGEVQASYIMPASGPPKGSKEGEVTSTKDYGEVQVDWAVQESDKDIDQFHVTWHCLSDGAVQQRLTEHDIRTSQFQALQRKTLYDIVVEPKFKGERVLSEVQHVGMLIPGPPDPPEIWLRNVDTNEFVIEWGEPRLYGVKIGGYQVYLNQKKVGNILSVHHRKAVIPCKPNKEYKVSLVALSSDPRFESSGYSNTLTINTGVKGHVHSLNDDDMVGQTDGNELNIKVVRVTDSSIHLDWSQYVEIEGMMYYRVVWSSVAQPAEREVKLPAGEKSCVIHKCFPGTCHFIRIYAMGSDDQILDRSRQINAQTSAAPDSPVVTLRAVNFKYIAVQWEKPNMYGDAMVTGYKIFVNGVVEALLGPDQFTYSYTQGKWCREYVFQVQALTATEKLLSKTSEPLVVTWPGVQPPVLRRAPAVSGNAVKVVWEEPRCTEGVKIKQYKAVVLDEVTERPAQVISPIHPDTFEAEIHGLKQGAYIVYLEVHISTPEGDASRSFLYKFRIHGSNEVVKSDILRIQPLITPDAPQISVTVVGLEERRQIEKVTCDLINKRDRLLNILASRDGSSPRPDEDQLIVKAAETLGQVEEMLDDCLQSLNHYTGHLLAHVSWSCPQSNPDLRISGYKVLVDGKQYGTTLHSGVKNVRIKLGLNQSSHRISMVSVCDRPHTMSVESNSVELLTEPFLPFSFYNFLSQNPRNNKNSSVSYQEALNTERKSHRKPVNQGLLKRHVSPPATTLMDIFEGEYHPMFPPSGPKAPTALLFWSKWCSCSQKMLGWFVKYARAHASQYEFMAIACSNNQITASERQELVQCVTDNGWREDTCIRHVIGQASNVSPPSPEKRGHDCYVHLRGPPASSGAVIYSDGTVRVNESHKGGSGDKTSDPCSLFGVLGVPTIVIVHPQDYIAWKGRYCAFDFSQFDHFMNYIFAQTMKQNPPWPDPWDTSIDASAIEGNTKKRISEQDMLIHRPTGTGSLRTTMGSTATTIHLNGMGRPQSAKRSRLFVKTNTHKKAAATDYSKLSVNSRPYSASTISNSPYSQKIHGSPPRRVKSGRKVKSTS